MTQVKQIVNVTWKHMPVTRSSKLPSHMRDVSKKWSVRLMDFFPNSPFVISTWADTRLCPNLERDQD